MIIDTDVVIWHLRGNARAKRIIHDNIPFGVSMVTYIELIQGMRDKQELHHLIRQFATWNIDIIQIDRNISTRAMIYVEQYYHSASMQLADALIAATCVDRSEVLLTGNEKHYKIVPNIQIERFAAKTE